MELEGFILPVTDFYKSARFRESDLGSGIMTFDFKTTFDWSSIRIALIGLPQNGPEAEEFQVANEIRRALAALTRSSRQCNVMDVGNIIRGKTPKDTAFAIGEVVAQLHAARIITILLGSSLDLGLGNFLGFVSNKKPASLINIDARINLLYDGERVPGHLPLDEIIFRNSEYLFNFANIGYQSFYVSQKEIDLLDDLYFDAYRLGVVRASLKDYEPVLRDAEIVNLSLNAVKYCDSPGSAIQSPNGFTGDEACQLSFYAGLSCKTMAFGVFDIGISQGHEISCLLAGQIIWYFIEGVNNQINESPQLNNNDFTRFVVNVNQLSQEFVFYRSNKSNRWWVEVPVKENDHVIISCSAQDYDRAVGQEIPERWWKMFQKLN
jgi:hypothetical protein